MSESTQSDHDLVLEAIDIISNRKNRPNIARIYRHMIRTKKITSAACEKLLDELVELGRVMKVTYKGNISYRNAAKWKHINRPKPAPSRVNRRSSSFLSGSIAELVARVPVYLQTGVPCKVLEDHLMVKDARFTKESIHKLLQKELQQETLVQLDNGNYYLSGNGNSNTNSTVSEDSDSNELLLIKTSLNESSKVVNSVESIAVPAEEDNSNERNEVDDNAAQEEEMVEEDEEEGYKTADEAKDGSEPRSPAISGESDEESNNRSHDEDYLPPYHVKVKNKGGKAGRVARRSKKTRYDASEYVFPSLRRTSKTKEKMVMSKQAKKFTKDLTSKEFKKSLLEPVSCGNASNPNSSLKNKSDFRINRHLAKADLSDLICFVCKNPNALILKANTTHCKLCKRKAHRECVETDQTSAKLKVNLWSWTCANCRFIVSQPCSVCHQTVTSEVGPLVICSVCRLSYHRCCHEPAIPRHEALTGSWRCKNCKDMDGNNKPGNQTAGSILQNIGTITTQKISDDSNVSHIIEHLYIEEGMNAKNRAVLPALRKKKVSYLKINDSSATRPQQQQCSSGAIDSSLPTPSSSAPSSQSTVDTARDKEIGADGQQPELECKKEDLPADVPDSSSWTPTDVFEYFKEHFDEKVATALFKQEIDGNSLKLLRRSDVLRGLGFKLGVGLNVLYHVRMLQLRTSDLRQIWKADA